MDISVVIVNYNTKELLRDCLNSLIISTSNIDTEIWVVDNASTDGSCLMVEEEFPSIRLIKNSDNVGFARANNQALRQSSGEFVLLLNPDTIVLERAIEKMADYIKGHPPIGVIGPKVLNPDGTMQLACRRSIPRPWAAFCHFTGLSKLFPQKAYLAQYNLTYFDEDQAIEVEAISGCCMMVRKTALEQVGLLDESFFMYGEDLDWCFRLHQKGWMIFYYPEAKIIHYHGASSKKRRFKSLMNFYQAMYLFHKKHFAKDHWFFTNTLIYIGIILVCFKAVAVNYLIGSFRK